MKNELLKLFFGTLFFFGISILFAGCEKEVVLTEFLIEDNIDNRGPNLPVIMNCEWIDEKFPVEALSTTEKDALVFMIEEEKLARDVYLKMKEKYDLRIFYNISEAENRHMNAIKCLLTKYGLELPEKLDEEGMFVNQELQQLYAILIEKGETNLVEALKVGATIEDLDIKDLMTLSENEDIDNKDIVAVFEELTRGSRNHMRAFSRNLEANESSYEVQYISGELYESILSGDQERGSGLCGKRTNCSKKGNCKNTCMGGQKGPNGPKGNKGKGNCMMGNGQGNGQGPRGNQGNNGN
jgi:hypothetical protein